MNNLLIGGAFAAIAGIAVVSMAVSFGPKVPPQEFLYEHASAQEQGQWLNDYGVYLSSTMEDKFSDIKGERTVSLESIDPARRAITLKVAIANSDPQPTATERQSEEFQKARDEEKVAAQKIFCEPDMLKLLDEYGTIIGAKAEVNGVVTTSVETSHAACNVLRQ